MTAREIKQRLFELQDVKFREFHSRLIPNIDPATVIGVRTPELRRLAKEIGEDEGFLRALPHEYYEENQLHALIITGMKDFGGCIARLDEFLPYADNWATTDIMTVKLFKKHTAELLPHIRRWLDSGRTYTVRYAAVIPYIEGRRLDTATHRRTIQKAVESFRITDEQKAYLRMLR